MNLNEKLDAWEKNASHVETCEWDANSRVIILVKALRASIGNLKFIADFDEEIQPRTIDSYAAREAIEEIEAILDGSEK